MMFVYFPLAFFTFIVSGFWLVDTVFLIPLNLFPFELLFMITMRAWNKVVTLVGLEECQLYS